MTSSGENIWERPVCWTCKGEPPLLESSDKIWRCSVCSGEYVRCVGCHAKQPDTFESVENMKGDECRKCDEFYCISHVQNTGSLLDEDDEDYDVCRSNWYCEDCTEKE